MDLAHKKYKRAGFKLIIKRFRLREWMGGGDTVYSNPVYGMRLSRLKKNHGGGKIKRSL